MSRRAVPLVVVASPSAAVVAQVAAQLRADGNVVYVAHSAEGCLRVATSTGPDMVLLDPSFPARIEKLIKAHPSCANAQVLHLSESAARPSFRLPRAPVAAA